MSFTLTLQQVDIDTTSQKAAGTADIQNNPIPLTLWFYIYSGANKCSSPLNAIYVLKGGTVAANYNNSVTSFYTSISPGSYSMNVVAYSNGAPVLTSDCRSFTINNGSSLGSMMNFNNGSCF
jgi:hypothetical protein